MASEISVAYGYGQKYAAATLGLEKVALLPAIGAGLMTVGRMALPWLARAGTRLLARGGATLGQRALNGAMWGGLQMATGDMKGGLISGGAAALGGPMAGMAASAGQALLGPKPPPPPTYGNF